ncbi:hypothetical protein DL771_004490 [Monosporascus sp. 5C6A]|nr:hypothetical protein DL771_004490 [Monosporascus sp. 5C6A]
MLGILKTLAVVAAISCSRGVLAQHGSDDEVEDMGPAAFMWPPDREWLSYHDNVAPCGTSSGPTNRTNFPLSKASFLSVARDERRIANPTSQPAARLRSSSRTSHPQSNDDFEVLVSADRIRELDPGHQCVNIADPPSDVGVGSNATLQIRYTSEFDEGVNETYYACADITYVRARDFTYRIPCFNATEEEPEPSPTPPSPAPAENEDADGIGGGLSGGAVAGIAIGAVAAVSLVAVVLFFLYRRDQREKRLAEHRLSNRNVKWDEDVAASSASRSRTSGGTADSGVSVQLRDLASSNHNMDLDEVAPVFVADRRPNEEFSPEARAFMIGAVAAGATQTRVAEAMGIERQRVGEQIQRFKTYRTVHDLPRGHRQRAIRGCLASHLYQLGRRYPRDTYRQLQEKTGTHISRSTMKRFFRTFALRKWRAAKRIKLSADDARKRLRFVNEALKRKNQGHSQKD